MKAGLLLLANYFIGYLFLYPLVSYFQLGFWLIFFPGDIDFLVFVINLLATFSVTLLLSQKVLKSDRAGLKFWPLLGNSLVFLFFVFVGLLVIADLSLLYDLRTLSVNQKLIEYYLALPGYKTATVLMILFFGPVVEELVFRYGLATLISRHRFWYVLVSAVSFGAVHIVGSLTAGDLADFVNIIYYGFLGGSLAVFYLIKNKNIYYPIFAHFLFNGVVLWMISS